MVLPAIMEIALAQWPLTSVLRGTQSLEIVNGYVRVMEIGMGRYQDVNLVSILRLPVAVIIFSGVLDSVLLTIKNIVILVFSVLLWTSSFVLMVIEVTYITCIALKCLQAPPCSVSLRRRHKVTYIVLFIVEVAILLLVIILLWSLW